MRYRRNVDNRLRKLERAYAAASYPDNLMELNRARLQSGMEPEEASLEMLRSHLTSYVDHAFDQAFFVWQMDPGTGPQLPFIEVRMSIATEEIVPTDAILPLYEELINRARLLGWVGLYTPVKEVELPDITGPLSYFVSNGEALIDLFGQSSRSDIWEFFTEENLRSLHPDASEEVFDRYTIDDAASDAADWVSSYRTDLIKQEREARNRKCFFLPMHVLQPSGEVIELPSTHTLLADYERLYSPNSRVVLAVSKGKKLEYVTWLYDTGCDTGNYFGDNPALAEEDYLWRLLHRMPNF